MAVLAEPNRRRILELLGSGEQSVTELASHFGVTRSAISQHLGVLTDAGLVRARQEGRYRYYRLDAGGMADLRAALDTFWNTELQQLAAAGAAKEASQRMAAEKSVLIPLDAEATFTLLTEPDRLRRWKTVAARVDLRAGGDYRFTVTPGHTAAGTFREIEPGRRLVFTWGWEGSTELPPGASTVTVTLEPADGGTLVRLVHEGLNAEQLAGHLEGWDHFLGRLATAARTGDAGDDEWAAVPDPMDPIGAAEASLALCQRALRDLDPAEGQLQTPCARYTVDDLLDHLLGSITQLGGAAGADVPDRRDLAPEARVADAAQAALEAWRRRGTSGTVMLGPSELPAAMPVKILTLELLVHGWDVANTVGRPYRPSEELSSYVLELAHQTIRPDARDGDFFAQEADPGVDASNLERLVAFTGRAVAART